MSDTSFKHVHYFLDPSSQDLDDLLGLHWKFPPHQHGGGGGAFSNHVETSAPKTPRALTVSIVEPDQEEEAEASEMLSGGALAAWQRSAPRRALSNALKGMRSENNLSQMQVGTKMRVTQSDIARMESSAGPWPSQAKLAAYAQACGMKAVVGFIDGSNDEDGSTMKIVPLGGTFGDSPEEIISAGDFVNIKTSKNKLYE